MRDGVAPGDTSAVRGIVESAQHLLEHGEPQVVLEELCDNLFEYDVPLGAELYSAIAALAKDMKLRFPEGARHRVSAPAHVIGDKERPALRRAGAADSAEAPSDSSV